MKIMSIVRKKVKKIAYLVHKRPSDLLRGWYSHSFSGCNMNATQENQVGMFYSVQATAVKHSEAWQGLPAFSQSYDQFSDLVSIIAQTARDQLTGITGATVDKHRARRALTEVAFPIGTAFQSWALAQGNDQLATQAYHPRTDYLYQRDTAAETYASKLLEVATPHIADLGDYGISQADLDELEEAITGYHDLLVAPRTAITDRKAATLLMAQAFAEARAILRFRLDKLVPLIAQDYSEFAVDWWNARQIVDSAGGGDGGSTPTLPPATGGGSTTSASTSTSTSMSSASSSSVGSSSVGSTSSLSSAGGSSSMASSSGSAGSGSSNAG